MACAWQYLQPVALLETQAIILFNADVTRPSLAITALFKFMKALDIAGLRCMVNTEFGQKPKVSLKNSANSLVSKSCAAESGVTKGIFYIFKFNIVITFVVQHNLILHFLKIELMVKNIIKTVWTEKSQFKSDNPSGYEFTMFDKSQDNGDVVGFAPKALMLSSLAGCSGLDVVSLLEKMRAEVANFKIEVTAELTDEHPKFYNKVKVDYHFTDSELHPEKIQKAVNLSVTKYCGVMEMFRQFADVEIEIFLHEI